MTLALTKTFEKAMGEKFTHGIERYVVSSGRSTEEKKIICCYLSKYIQIFEDLVRNAVTLDDDEKKDHLKVLYNDCGIERDAAECDVKKTTTSFDWSAQRANSDLCV